MAFGFANALSLAVPLGGIAGALLSVGALVAIAGRRASLTVTLLAGLALASLAGAAIALIRMKPRAGRRVAFTAIDPKGDLDPCKGTLVDAMATITPEVRQTIIASLVPAIINELKKPPPAAQANQAAPPDGSYPFKDAAYAMLTLDRTVIVAQPPLHELWARAAAPGTPETGPLGPA